MNVAQHVRTLLTAPCIEAIVRMRLVEPAATCPHEAQRQAWLGRTIRRMEMARLVKLV